MFYNLVKVKEEEYSGPWETPSSEMIGSVKMSLRKGKGLRWADPEEGGAPLSSHIIARLILIQV